MSKILPYAVLAAACALAAPALAQKPSPAAPPASSAAPASSEPSSTPPTASARTGTGADTAANAAAPASLTTGMSVKDNTGALIGEVKSLKGNIATIQMGADTFTVDADKLGVAGGAATINATQAELKKMLPKK